MQTNDHFPDSGKPFRSERLNEPKSAAFTNNRLTLELSRGTWRFQALCVQSTDAAILATVLIAVTHHANALEHFPAGVIAATGNGEILPVATSFFHTTAKTHSFSPGYPVELDVLDGQRVVLWCLNGSEAVKYVKVGELPPRDPIVNDNHSGAFE